MWYMWHWADKKTYWKLWKNQKRKFLTNYTFRNCLLFLIKWLKNPILGFTQYPGHPTPTPTSYSYPSPTPTSYSYPSPTPNYHNTPTPGKKNNIF